MRTKIVAGNWKMNKNEVEAYELMVELLEYQKKHEGNCKVLLSPPSLYLMMARKIFKNDEVEVFAQDVSEHNNGAYTGEISSEMLKFSNVNGAIVGHSERRNYHAENDEQVSRKIKQLLNHGLTPIYCNGETLEQRISGKHFEIVKQQTETALFQLSPEEMRQVIIAYEPVWAIGTGETASAEQAQEIHAYIRQLIAEKYGANLAEEIPILYGGSVKPNNAREIFSQPDVDGGLIGGAALDVADFTKIIQSASSIL